jgi:hypothetical protein
MNTAVRFAIASLCAVPVFAQQAAAPVYTYVAEWAVPRAQWKDEDFQFQQLRPILERRLADGSIVEWGRAIPLVHTADGPTHTNWYVSPTIAGIYRVLEDLRKLPPAAFTANSKHTDRLFRSMVFVSKDNIPRRSAYMMTSVVTINPGKGQDWRALWNKNTLPVYEQAMKDGTILGYGLDQEWVHTMSPGARFEWIMLPSIESVDKLNEAFRSRQQARSGDENRALGAAFRDATDGASHRDGLWYVVDWARK